MSGSQEAGVNDLSQSSGLHLEIESSVFEHYVDRRAFFLDSSAQDWAPNVTFRDCTVADNDNNKSSRASALFGVYHDDLSQLQLNDSSSVIAIESTLFRGNGDLFSIVEDCRGCSTQSLSMRFDDVRFADNYGSTLYHGYYSDLVAMTITFNDCQWSGNRGDLPSEKAHSVATSLMEIVSRDAADCQKQGTAQGGAHLILENNNNFTANVFYPDSLIAAYCGQMEIARSTFSGNNESILSTLQSEVEIAESTFVGNEQSGDSSASQCILCLAEASTVEIMDTVFAQNEGNLMYNDLSSLTVQDSLFEQHSGRIALFGVSRNESVLLLSSNVTQSVSRADDALFVIAGGAAALHVTRIKWQNVSLTDNNGTILATEVYGHLSNSNLSSPDWQCPNQSESYDESTGGLLQFENVEMTDNTVTDDGYLMDLEFHRMLISSLSMSSNLCADTVGCISLTDCSLTMSSSVFAGNEGSSFMLSSQRRSSSLAFITSTELCLSTTTVANETSDSWLSVSNYSSLDWISIEHSLVDSANIEYFVSMTGSTISDEAAVNGLNLEIDSLNASNVSSAVLNWDTASSSGDYYLATLNVTNSRFSTTALRLQLGSSALNEESRVSFASNVFHSYTSYYAEDYLLSLDTMGAPLRCELDSNVFVDGANDVSHYLLLSGPMDVVMTNQAVDDDSSWLSAQDVHSMHIADHLFGPNFLSSAIVMERVNVTLTPSVSISIMDSRFENEGSDYEMVTLSNVQPTDEVVLESDHFVHSFITIKLVQ